MKKLLAIAVLSVSSFVAGMATFPRSAAAVGQFCVDNSNCGHCEVCVAPPAKPNGKCEHIAGCY